MSIKFMNMVWAHTPDLRGERKLALLALADWANDQGYCWPSLTSLARKCTMTRRGAHKIVQYLEQAGYVTSIPGRGRGNPNRYHLNFPPVEGAVPRGVNPEKGAILCEKGASPGELSQEKGASSRRAAVKKGEPDDIKKGNGATRKGARPGDKWGTGYAQSVREPLRTDIKTSDREPSVRPGADAPAYHSRYVNVWVGTPVPCKEPGCEAITTNRSGYCNPHLPPVRDIHSGD